MESPLTCGVFVAEGRFPAEIMHHVGEVPLGARDNHVRRGAHDSREALFHCQSSLPPGGHAALQYRHVLVAQSSERRPGQRGILTVARASKHTGAPVYTHTRSSDRVGEQQVRILQEEGVDMNRVYIGHSNDTSDVDYIIGLLESGVWVGLDWFPGGRYPGVPLWQERTEIVKRLIDEGWGGRIMLGHDYSVPSGQPTQEMKEQRANYQPEGYSLISRHVLPYLNELAPHIEEYLKAWKDAGHPGVGEVSLRVPIYVADTEEKAYSEPRESALNSMTGLAQRVAGSASREGTTGDWQAESERIAKMTYDDWLRDKVVYGTPDRVVDRLRQLIEELQLTQIVYEINCGRQIPYELQKNCLRLITEQVVPSFN